MAASISPADSWGGSAEWMAPRSAPDGDAWILAQSRVYESPYLIYDLGMRGDSLHDRISEAARELCQQASFFVAGKDIAEAARVSEASMYRRFPRRLDILEALLQELLRDLDARLEALCTSGSSDPVRMIRGINVICLDHVDRYGRLASDLYSGRLPTPLHHYLPRMEPLRGAMAMALNRGIEEGLFSSELNVALCAVAWRSLISPDTLRAFQGNGARAPSRDVASVVSDFFLSALAAPRKRCRT